MSSHSDTRNVVVWIVIGSLSPVACSAEEAVFDKSLVLPQQIQSYEFVCKETRLTSITNPVNGEKVSLEPVWTQFLQLGDMYRVNIVDGSEPDFDAKPDRIMAFNGEKYQNYAKELDALSFTRSNRFPMPYMAVNPLTLLYTWVTGAPDAQWHALRDPASWSLRDSVQGSDERQEVNGLECLVFRVSSNGEFKGTHGRIDGKWTVYVAESLNYLPVRMNVEDRSSGKKSQVDVLETITVSSDVPSDSDVICPVSIRMSDSTGAGPFTPTIRWDIDPETWRINHPIPLDTFTIPITIATTVDDFDGNFAKLQRQSSSEETEGTSLSSVRRWVILANIVLVVCVAIYLVRRYNK